MIAEDFNVAAIVLNCNKYGLRQHDIKLHEIELGSSEWNWWWLRLKDGAYRYQSERQLSVSVTGRDNRLWRKLSQWYSILSPDRPSHRILLLHHLCPSYLPFGLWSWLRHYIPKTLKRPTFLRENVEVPIVTSISSVSDELSVNLITTLRSHTSAITAILHLSVSFRKVHNSAIVSSSFSSI